MAKRKILTKLEISEISGVDFPAQRDALHAITKRGMPDFEVETRIYKSERALKLKVLLLQVLDLKKSLRVLAKAYNPDQDRADDGKWTAGGGGSSSGGGNKAAMKLSRSLRPAGAAGQPSGSWTYTSQGGYRGDKTLSRIHTKATAAGFKKETWSDSSNADGSVMGGVTRLAHPDGHVLEISRRFGVTKEYNHYSASLRLATPAAKAAELLKAVTKLGDNLEAVIAKYDDDQPRDDGGRWTSGGGGGGKGSGSSGGGGRIGPAPSAKDFDAKELKAVNWMVKDSISAWESDAYESGGNRDWHKGDPVSMGDRKAALYRSIQSKLSSGKKLNPKERKEFVAGLKGQIDGGPHSDSARDMNRYAALTSVGRRMGLRIPKN